MCLLACFIGILISLYPKYANIFDYLYTVQHYSKTPRWSHKEFLNCNLQNILQVKAIPLKRGGGIRSALSYRVYIRRLITYLQNLSMSSVSCRRGKSGILVLSGFIIEVFTMLHMFNFKLNGEFSSIFTHRIM